MVEYYLGLDLGQSQDYSAVAILEQVAKETEEENRYHLRHLERFPLGTSYPDVAAKVKKMLATEQLRENSILIMDLTGVGRPVLDMMVQSGLYPEAINITGGNEVHRTPEGHYNIPKRDLVSTLMVLFQSNRLKVAEKLPAAKILVDELLNFRAKISLKTGHDSYEAWREGQHDDLVLAVALASWYAERFGARGNSGGIMPSGCMGGGQRERFDFDKERGREEWEDAGGDDGPGFFGI